MRQAPPEADRCRLSHGGLAVLRGLVAAIVLFAAGTLLACGGRSPDEPTPVPSAEPTTQPTPVPTPDATANARRTGIPEVDAVIDAVLSRDAAQLRTLVRFQRVACIGPTPGNLGALFCEDGELEGTESTVLPAVTCEGYYIREEELTLDDPTLNLYAVHRTEGGGYSIVFSRVVNDNLWSMAVNMEDAEVTSLNFGCADSPEEMLANVPPADFVLLPP